MSDVFGEIVVLVSMQRRLLLTRGRVWALGALGAVVVLLAAITAGADDPPTAAFQLIRSVGLAGLVPIVSLVFGSAALGDANEDGTLVHLWLRPISRWSLVLSSWITASLTGFVFATVPLVTASALARVGSSFVVGTALSSALGVLAYSALFVALGLRTTRALAWGLGYILLWEGSIGQAGTGLSRLAVRTYTSSLLRSFSDNADVRIKFATSSPGAVIGATVACALGLALGRRLLSRIDTA